MTWENRIIRYDEVDPSALKFHRANWRLHPERQAQALRAVLNEVGWVRPVIVNERTMTIVDGHLRVLEALAAKLPTVPVDFVNLTHDEERTVLTAFDPIGALAFEDEAVFAELSAAVASTQAEVQALLSEHRATMPKADGAAPAHQVRYEPSDVLLTVGEYKIKVPHAQYLAWRERMYQTVGFESPKIIKALLRALDL